MVLEPKRKALKRTHKKVHSEAHNAPYLPYDSKDLFCLPAGATVEEREQNCREMEEKKKQVEKALENPETLPVGETYTLAKKRAKYLGKQIAKEEKIISMQKEKKNKLAVAACIKNGKKWRRSGSAKLRGMTASIGDDFRQQR